MTIAVYWDVKQQTNQTLVVTWVSPQCVIVAFSGQNHLFCVIENIVLFLNHTILLLAPKTRPRAYTTYFILNSAEHVICPAHKCQNAIDMINTTYERPKARNFYICRYFCFYEQLKFRAQLS